MPQDFRLLGYALGSITTTSGTAQGGNWLFNLSEQDSDVRHNAYTSGTLNPWISFTLQDARDGPVANKNLIRTFKGCVVNSYSLSSTEGEPVTAEVGFIAQTGSFTSGAITTATAGSNRPYLWNDVTVQVPGGTSQTAVKSFNFTVENNFEGPHYLDGTRQIAVPYPLDRNYTLEITQDADDDAIGSLYHTYFLGGSIFNAVVDINNAQDTGSHHLVLTMSGCNITTMDSPVELSSVGEISYTIVPGSVSAISYDRQIVYTPF